MAARRSDTLDKGSRLLLPRDGCYDPNEAILLSIFFDLGNSLVYKRYFIISA